MIELGGQLCQESLRVAGFAGGEPTGLAGLFGDRDLQFRAAAGGDAGVAGLPGAEHRRADPGGDLGGGQRGLAGVQQRAQHGQRPPGRDGI
jgi:hypothetical protein